jgi:cobalt-zinc-cadmium efflux system outer membrane protein
MKWQVIISTALGLSVASLWESHAIGQGIGATRGEDHEPSTRQPRLGPAPGAGSNPLGGSPGTSESVLEGQLGMPGARLIPDSTAPSQSRIAPESALPLPPALPVAARAGTAVGAASPYGSLALPGEEEDGPANGLTLDQAMDRLVRCNLDLRSKSLEIPQAEADTLTASLRANPILYTDVQCVPYGSFSRARPGGQTQYDLNLTYPLDVTGKRRARTLVAYRARRVIEAQYQDAVREAIDDLYTEFVDVLATRETVREAVQAAADFELEARSHTLKSTEEDQRLEVQRESAEIALTEAQEQLKSDLRALGTLLQMSPDEAEHLELTGSLHDRSPAPVKQDALLRLALVSRPDLVAYRLGTARADADVGLALANRYPDLFVLVQPYTFQDDRPLGLKSAHSWGVGVGVPVPLFNRNQGNIRRARLNVAQTHVEMAALENRVVMEVRQADRQYEATRVAVERIERSLLPKATQEHDRIQKLFLAGKTDELAFLTAEHDFDLVVRQYRDSLVRHRRAMLKLNSAVGVRILP